MFLKVIACEIAFREICWAAAQSPNVMDLEFLTQGYHDNPGIGIQRIQARVDAVPEGTFDAILIGYGLCSNMLVGLAARHTPLVIPRAHDCLTFFLGSKERYKEFFFAHPGTFYYTAGWLEYRQRGGERVERKQGAGIGPGIGPGAGASTGMPSGAGARPRAPSSYQQWVAKYGEENARYLVEMMDQWTSNYTHGVLIDFDFTKHLNLCQQVQAICQQRGWQYDETAGDLRLLQHWLDGKWDTEEFLVVRPSETVHAAYDDRVIEAKAPSAAADDQRPTALRACGSHQFPGHGQLAMSPSR